MSAVFYEPGFAVLRHRLGLLTRRGITIMTLVGGFASTVFIPLTHLLIEAYGWRVALLILAALQHRHLRRSCMRQASRPLRSAGAASGWQRSRATDLEPAPGPRQAGLLVFVATSCSRGSSRPGFPIHLIPILRGARLHPRCGGRRLCGDRPGPGRGALPTGFGERAMSLRGIGVLTMALERPRLRAPALHPGRVLADPGLCRVSTAPPTA